MKKKKVIIAVFCIAILSTLLFSACNPYTTEGRNYGIKQIDLTVQPTNISNVFKDLYTFTTVDNTKEYQINPSTVLMSNGHLLTVYPKGEGKDTIKNKVSKDYGQNWLSELPNIPNSWSKTPKLYTLAFNDGSSKIILISNTPKSSSAPVSGGFICSTSSDNGESWSATNSFFDKKSSFPVYPVAGMSSLTKLKENGVFVDKWLGLFHDKNFVNYKSILHFDSNGNMNWSEPEPFFSAYRKYEKATNMREVEIIRSDLGKGDKLCMIASNSTSVNSTMAFSSDEGETWSEPREAPAFINGEHHKAIYTNDGRIYMTFKSIERSKDKIKALKVKKSWYSEGLIAWLGTFSDLENAYNEGKEGGLRVKLAHTYLPDQKEPGKIANGDTGYCGNVVLYDGTILTTSYGTFGDCFFESNGQKKHITYIISKKIDLNLLDQLVSKLV